MAIINYRSIQDLNTAITANIYKIPYDADIVVGVPRSGLVPATIIALHRNLPITDVDGLIAGRTFSPGISRSKYVRDQPTRKALIVDDSVGSGRQMNIVRARIREMRPDLDVFCLAIFGSREGASAVDLVFEYCETPRVFEWNLMHSKIIEESCVDMDGVLCEDPSDEQNDDAENYAKFLASAKPHVLPTVTIGHIVTSRLEKYREPTRRWLDQNSVRYRNLTMLDLPSKEERKRQKLHSKFKADVYLKSGARLFVESSLRQAQEIADITLKPVFCFDARKMIVPSSGVLIAEGTRLLPGYLGRRIESVRKRLVRRLSRPRA